MGRIEIPLAEYNSLHNNIESLNQKLSDLEKKIKLYEAKLTTIEDLVMDLNDENIYNRLFRWKKIVSPLKNLFK